MAYPYDGYPPGYMPGYYGAQPMQDNLARLRTNQQPMPPEPPKNSIIWVQGEAGAKSYMVAPGASVLLMDSEHSTFYLKTADASGMPSMRVFDYTERTTQMHPQQNVQTADFVTRKEFDALAQRLEALAAAKTEVENHAESAV